MAALFGASELAALQGAVMLAELRAPVATLRQLAETLDRARHSHEPRVAAQAARDVAVWADALAAGLRRTAGRLEDATTARCDAVSPSLFEAAP